MKEMQKSNLSTPSCTEPPLAPLPQELLQMEVPTILCISNAMGIN